MANMMDRLRNLSTDSRMQDSTTPVAAELETIPQVLQRTKALMKYLMEDLKKKSTASKRGMFILQRIIDDAVEEAREYPPEMIEAQMRQAAASLYWAATGQNIVNIPLPEEFWDGVGYTSPELEASSRYKEIAVTPDRGDEVE